MNIIATIQTQFNLTDQMSGPLKSINAVLETVVSQMQNVDNSIERGFDTKVIDEARRNIDLIGIELEQINTQTQQNTIGQKNYNKSVDSGLSVLSKMSAAFGLMGLGYTAKVGFTVALDSASQLEATEAKFNTVFGEFTQQAQNIVDDFQKLTPATESSTRSMVSGIQDLLVPMGFARSEATDMTSEIMTLTGALTNFNSATHTAEDVASVFSSALVGEYDSLKALGVQLNVDTVKQHAVAMGLANTTSEVTTQQQALAMLELAYEQSGDALDAYNVDSLDTISNMGLLKAGFIDVFAEAGQSMLPKVNEILVKIKDNMPMITSVIYSVVDGFVYLLDIASIFFDYGIIGINNLIANWYKYSPIINAVGSAMIGVFNITKNGVAFLLNILSNFFNFTLSGLNLIIENWSIISPIIYGVVGAILVYNSAIAISNGLTKTNEITSKALTFTKKILTSSTLAGAVAQMGFNSALLASPITWYIAGIIAIISVFYMAIAIVNKFTGVNVSATGVICGAIAVMSAVVGNLLLGLWNGIIDGGVSALNFIGMFANFFGNVWNDPLGASCRLFYDFYDVILGVLQSITNAIDLVFGSNLSKAIKSFREDVSNWSDDKFGTGDVYWEYANADDFKLDRFNYGEAIDTGYDFGKNIDNNVKGLFTLDTSSFDLPNGIDAGSYDLTTNIDPNLNSNIINTSDLGESEWLDTLEGIENNTSDVADSVNVPQEDLKYLLDIAQRDTVNRFTTAQVKVDLGGVTNNVNNNNDLDSFVDYLANGVNEAMEKTADGVYV